MLAQLFRLFSAAVLAVAVGFAAIEAASAEAVDDGVVRVRSAHSMNETVARLKEDIAEKGIMFFFEVDQAALAAGAGVSLRPSRLLVFGNPPLGTQFLTSNPHSGLDWPVRILVFEDEAGAVWTAYTDFAWIARRHGIRDRDAQFRMASEVIASIIASVAGD